MLASLLAALGTAGWLLAGAPGGTLTLGGGLAIGLDRIGGFFLLLVLLETAGVAAARDTPQGRTAVQLGGAILALVAGDAMTLLAGVGLAAGTRRGPMVAGLALLGGVALLGGGDFAAMRLAAPGVGLAWCAMVVAGLWPGVLGMFLVARLLVDLGGTAPGGVAMLGGGLVAAWGGWQAWRAMTFPVLIGGLGRMLAGMGLLGASIALAGRAIDFAGPAALGMASLWGAAVVLGTSVPVLAVLAGVAGTDALRRAAGVMRSGGFFGLASLAAGLTVACVPPGGGFAVVWQVFRALRALPISPVEGAVAAFGVAAGVSFAVAAVVRLLAIGFEGAAERAAAPRALERNVMALLAGLGLLAAMVPGAVAALAGGEAPGAIGGTVGLLMAGLVMVTAVVTRRLGSEGHRVIVAGAGAVEMPSRGLVGVPGLRAVIGWRKRLAVWGTGRDPLALRPLLGLALGLAVLLLLARVVT